MKALRWGGLCRFRGAPRLRKRKVAGGTLGWYKTALLRGPLAPARSISY
jgi:hypothetical protein